MKMGQKAIYYLCAPSRESAMSSPYMETFTKNGTEVLFLYQPIDEFVMKNLASFNGRKLVSVESSEASSEHDDKKDKPSSPLGDDLVKYFSNALASRVSHVSTTDRLVDSPAVIVDHESAHYRRMMKMMEQKELGMSKQKLEINPEHDIMKRLHQIKETKPEVAQLVADQIYDNAMLAADIHDNPREMLPRLNTLLSQAMESAPDADGVGKAEVVEEPTAADEAK
jgi:TNF receptor-associated protein 1